MHITRTTAARRLLLTTILLTVPACSPGTPPAAPGHGHSHDAGRGLLADAGKYHARLEAHLDPAGNELDVFFETTDERNPKPVALPLESFTAAVNVNGTELKELTFAPAPPDERPKDEKPGTCSHFVAKAPWMKPDDKLYVKAEVLVDGKKVTVQWRDFVPKDYAHGEK